MIYANMVDCDVFISLRAGAIMLDDDRTPFGVVALLGTVRGAGDDYLRVEVSEALSDVDGGGVTFDEGDEEELTVHASAVHLVQLLAEPEGDDDGGEDLDEEEDDEEEEAPPAVAAKPRKRPKLRAVG